LVPRPASYVVGQTLKVTFTATDAAVIGKTAE
jgi:hypothetical protein